MKYFLLLSLSLCFSSASVSAASTPLSYEDFKFDSVGDVLSIDKNGVELYLYYTGAKRVAGEDIRITIDDPTLKVTFGKLCNVKTSPDKCKFVLNYVNMKLPSYGKKTITVSNESQEKIVEYVIWVKPSKDEKEMRWELASAGDTVNGPVILQNGTHMTRTYRIHDAYTASRGSDDINLPGKSLCYVDKKLYHPKAEFDRDYFYFASTLFGQIGPAEYIEDYTNPSDKSYNAPVSTGNNNIASCATEGHEYCSRKWASWTVGLMNLSGKTLKSGSNKINPGEIKYLKNRSWNSGDTIYWRSEWKTERLAFLFIHGTTDGSGFDPSNISPSLQEVQTAPPCSKYINQPAPPQNTLVVRIKGPGTVSDERGVFYASSFQAYKVDDGMLLELNAVPEEGRKFTGWSGVNCSNDSLYCAFNVDGSTDITANFE